MSRVWVVSEYWKETGVYGKYVIAVFDNPKAAIKCRNIDLSYREITTIELNKQPTLTTGYLNDS